MEPDRWILRMETQCLSDPRYSKPRYICDWILYDSGEAGRDPMDKGKTEGFSVATAEEFAIQAGSRRKRDRLAQESTPVIRVVTLK